MADNELRVWLMDHLDPGPEMWSHWKHGRRPIAADHLLAFMKAQRVKDTQRVASTEDRLTKIENLLERLILAYDQNRQGRLKPRDSGGALSPPG